ncbi:MAG: ComEC/Rec2 family competence protein [Thermoguttaceae bacterium]
MESQSIVNAKTTTMKDRGYAREPLAICLLVACLGILTDRFCSPSLVVWLGLFAASLLSWCLIVSLSQSRPLIPTLLILLAIFATFGSWYNLYWNYFEPNPIALYATTEPQPVCLRGVVCESADHRAAQPVSMGQLIQPEPQTLFLLQVNEIRDREHWKTIAGRLAVVVEGEAALPQIGDTLELYGHLSSPTASKNPDDFDASLYWRTRRVLAVLRVPSPDACIVQKSSLFSLARLFESIRRNAQKNLQFYLTEKASPFASAALLGFREEVDEETNRTLLETGTMHILAISGLHISLIAGSLFIFCRALRLSIRQSVLLLIVFIVLYFFLTDRRPPAFRASLLVLLVCYGLFFNRRLIAINTLSATALIVLICNPSDLFQFGTQLSFLATSVFLWMPKTETLFRVKKIAPIDIHHSSWRFAFLLVVRVLFLPFFRLFLISLCISLFSLPLILSRIHLITPVALLVNPLLWIPLSIGLLSSLATMLFAWIFPPLAYLTGWSASWAFSLLQDLLDLFHQLPGAYCWFPAPPLWWTLGFYVPILFLTFFPAIRPQRRFIFAGLLIWCLIGWNYGYFRDSVRTQNDQLEIDVLSVGHGASTLILTPENKVLLYDAGCFSRPQIGADVTSRALWSKGKTRIDAIILSHSDTDHFNAVPILAERFTIGAVYVSPYMFLKDNPAIDSLAETLKKHQIPIFLIGQGDWINVDSNVKLSVLHPPKNSMEEDWESVDANSTSLVLLLEHRGFRTLFSGDLEKKNYSLDVPFLESPPTSCPLLLVPHHGGQSTLTESLLKWATPQTLLISGGRFTFKEEVIEQFQKAGYTVFHTMLDGRLRLIVDKSGVELTTFSGKKQKMGP